jgi:hypothetical protein
MESSRPHVHNPSGGRIQAADGYDVVTYVDPLARQLTPRPLLRSREIPGCKAKFSPCPIRQQGTLGKVPRRLSFTRSQACMPTKGRREATVRPYCPSYPHPSSKRKPPQAFHQAKHPGGIRRQAPGGHRGAACVRPRPGRLADARMQGTRQRTQRRAPLSRQPAGRGWQRVAAAWRPARRQFSGLTVRPAQLFGLEVRPAPFLGLR